MIDNFRADSYSRKKIIFVYPHPFFQRDVHRFGAEYLMKKGYSVELWRLFSDDSISFLGGDSVYQGENYYEYDYHEFKWQVGNHLDDIYILIGANQVIYGEIINRGCIYFFWDGMGGVFSFSDACTQKFSQLLYKKLKRAFQRGAFQSLLHLYDMIQTNHRIRKYKGIQRNNPPIQIVTSTRKVAQKYWSYEQLQGNVLYTHAMDYDRYIEENRKIDTDGKYIVFCDTGIGTIDYDTVYYNYEQINDRYRFLEQTEELIVALEKKYNLPTIILGHPNAIYENGTFFGRQVVRNRSCEYTKKAAVFILNVSLAINFAVLYDVPTLQVVNTEFKHLTFMAPNLYEYIKCQALDILGCGFLDMDDADAMKHPWDYVKRMDPMKRERYIHDYLIDNNTTDKCSYEYLEEVIRPYFL